MSRIDEETKGFKWLPKTSSEPNSFVSIRVIRGQTWLAGILILLVFPNAFAETDLPAFWNKFKSAIIAGDKAAVAEMTKFPVSMPPSPSRSGCGRVWPLFDHAGSDRPCA